MLIDFEALFAASPNPYVVIDTDLRIRWMNDAYLAATARQRDELLGQQMFDAFPSAPESESYRALMSSLGRVLETGEADELALIRYDIATPEGGMDVRYWSATHQPLLGADGKVAYILQHTVDVTELHVLRALRDEAGIVQRAQAVEARNRTLAEESDNLKRLLEQAPGFVAVLSGREHRFVMANAAYRRLVGDRDIVGKTVGEALPEVIDQGFDDLLDQVLRSGTAYVGRKERVTLANPGGEEEDRFLDFIYQPILTDNGQVSGIFVQGHDVTEEVEAAERQKLLINELNHRVKNTLAIVQSLAMQSFRTVQGAEPARRTFDARLNALAAAHGLLTSANWESARLKDVVAQSIEATVGAELHRVDIDGADIGLVPQAAVSLAMIVHELSTNAIKYGALSNEAGRVTVHWTVEDEGNGCRLCFDWTEQGGPAVKEPERRGFGTRLIQLGLSSERDSQVTMNFAPGGLRCRITTLLEKSA